MPLKFTTPNIIYGIKCIAGVSICFILYKAFPQYPFNWALVSVVLSFSPDNSNNLAVGRIKANLVGCSVGLCIYPLPLPGLVLLCLGIVMVLLVGFTFKIADTIRTALAAVVIVMLQEEHIKHWYIPLERVVCVMTGCVVALLLTFLFNLAYKGNAQARDIK